MNQQDSPAAVAQPVWRARDVGRLDWRVVLPCVIIVSALYVWWHLGRGWIPTDDGTLAESAERVLRGQLPHRDFDDVYTGGLALLDAAAFRLLGTNLWTLRLVLLAVFVAWVPAYFYIASRFVPPLAAAGIVFLGVAWSVPNYSAAMPSWFNLFLATFGVAALCRHLEDDKRRWLVAAGLAGGLSFLVKVIGLYYVAGVLLYLVFLSHARARAAAPGARRGDAYAAFVSVSLILFIAALVLLIRHQFYPAEVAQFVLPGALFAGLLVRNEWTQPCGSSAERFRALMRLLAPFLAGVALPVALFLLPYARDGAVGSFVHGVFVVPMQRVTTVAIPAPPLATMLAVLPFALIGWLAHRADGRMSRRETVLLVCALGLLLRATAADGGLYRTVLYAVRNLLPILAALEILLAARERSPDAAALRNRARTMLVLAVTALCNLVQFPFAHSIYFFYIAPLVFLTALALYSGVRRPIHAVPMLVVCFLAAFAVFRTNSDRVSGMGDSYHPRRQLVQLGLERGGIAVLRTDSMAYGALMTQLRAHAHGGYTWASPDAPEVYFLSGLQNPTRTLFDVFDDSTNRTARVLRALDVHGVTAVVLNSPVASAPISADMFTPLTIRYPRSQYIGPFQLRWRE